MKYESAILKRLIDTYGVVGNPKYISEIIKEFIVRGKECFPNLFTYQADWLAHIDEFGLSPSYTVSYTGQSIYAPNTLERPVKSANLKGSTKYRDIDTGEILETFEEDRNLELVSVKMPVLTTTGKNLFDVSKEIKNFTINIDNGHVNIKTNDRNTSDFIKVIPNTIYKCNVTMTRLAYYDKNKQFISPNTGVSQPITIPTSCNFVKFSYDNTLTNIQFEQGSIATPYEPHKSNILTVNEDVTLRGIGDVKDTLDLMTGEVVQSVGVLNGEEVGWKREDNSQAPTDSSLIAFAINLIKSPNKNLLSSVLEKSSDVNKPYRWYISFNTWLIITLPKSEVANLAEFKAWLKNNEVLYPLTEKSIKTVDLTILDQNEQNVKQLMSFNGGTHFNTMSLEGSLLPTLEVSVETDLEETLRVCSLEGNTM